jgi:ribosomal protein S8
MAKEKEIQLNNYVMIDSNPIGRGEEISEFEKDFMVKYLEDDFPDIKDAIDIQVINSNFFYETYSFVVKNKKFLFKISLDAQNEKLKTEKLVLESVTDLFAPSVVLYKIDKVNNINMLLTTWENGENFVTHGVDDLLYNIGTFSAVLDGVHESDQTGMQTFKDRFLQNESILPAIKESDIKELQIFEKLVDLSLSDISNIFTKIKEEFLNKYEEDISVLCHSNLKKSNILYKDGYIKFINFENSHSADIYYSLLKIVNNTGLYFNHKNISLFLTKYHEFSRILGDLTLEDFISRYEEKKEINRMLTFQDLLHKIIFHFFTYGAFYRCENLCHYMDVYLNLRPTLEKFLPEYIKSFDKLFFTPMPTVKTYDIEELKILASMSQEVE